MRVRVRVDGRSSGPAALALARSLQISPTDAKTLLSAPRVLPAQLTPESATALCEALLKAGVGAEQVDAPQTTLRCSAHPSLTGDGSCATCGQAVCPLCGTTCASCAAKAATSSKWKGRRVAVLLIVLAVVVFGAALRTQQLQRRTSWSRPLQVSVVLVSEVDVERITLRSWKNGLVELESWFATEATRHGVTLKRPVVFTLAPEVKRATLPPPPEPTGSLLDDASAARAYSEELAKVAMPEGDVRLVVVLGDSAGPGRVEGIGERGGVYGLVHASRQDTQLTLELMALAHELFHCLGADDAYDGDGHAVFPGGFVEPEKVPRFPQAFAEVMCGEVPLAADHGRLPKTLDEVGVGDVTARAIGWPR